MATEVGAELGISRGRASSQMHYGVELLERLPQLGAVFAAGEVDFRVVAVAVFRTGLITDPEVLTSIDTQLARCAPGWNALSQKKLVEYIDWRVRALDPAAERVDRGRDGDRHMEIEPDGGGLAELRGCLRAPDAAALDRRLDQLAASVCREDSRTARQRRADAVAALVAGASAMACDCGLQNCPGGPGNATGNGQIVIHVVAEAASVSGAGDRPGYLPGYGAIPAEMLRQLAARARLKPLTPPGVWRAESGYRPSAALDDFIRCRDVCCRFPGCDKPAEVCDIDHTVPWDRGGPTHPSNLALLCRPHYLLKTFWIGEKGWREEQSADGTIVWTSPSGCVYTTEPGCALFFPELTVASTVLTYAVGQPDSGSRPDSYSRRSLMMPTRRRSRAADRAARVKFERGLNEARWAADPPPF